jgi:uncharacterized membrane protein YobD (UPF0266 family)
VTNDLQTKHPMFQVSIYFFSISCKILCKNCSIYFSILFYKFAKIKLRVLSALSLLEIIKRIMLGTSDVWWISHLSRLTSVLYCRLSEFIEVA